MTTTDTVASRPLPDPARDLLARAAELVPLLRANAERTERERRIPEENLAALREAGLLRLSLPRAYGGYELGMRALLRICAELGRGCGSTSWVTTLLNTNLYTTAFFPEQAQAEVFGADPDVILSGVILGSSVQLKAVEGGYLLSGQWSFATGCLHAAWAVLGRVPTGDDESHAAALVPMSDLLVRDTWQVAGMVGTGSNTLVAEGVFVPRHRVVVFDRAVTDLELAEAPDAAGWQDQGTRRAVLIIGIVAPLLGLAQQAFELVQASLTNGRQIAYSSYRDARESPSTQLALARAAQLIDSSWLHALRSATELDDAETDRTVLDRYRQVRIHTDAGYIAQQCRAAVDILLDVNGAGSFADARPLQRVWRDIEVASRHGIINPMMAQESLGRLLVDAGTTAVWG